MAGVTYDTSLIIAYKLPDLPDNFFMSAVVLLELIAGANDASIIKAYEAVRRRHDQEGTLIVPTSEDWLLASKVLSWLAQGRKKKAGGKSPPLIKGASQRMALDALLAASARRVGVTVVTNNWDDFRAIHYYCNVKLRRGSEFIKGR